MTPDPTPLNWNSRSLTSGWQRGINAFYWGLGFSPEDFAKAQVGIGTPLLDTHASFKRTATYGDSVSVDATGIYNGFAGEPNNNRSGFTINVLQQQPTAINEHENWNALELWPNPVSEEINLSLIGSRSSRLQLSVIDLNGRVVTSTSNAIASCSPRPLITRR